VFESSILQRIGGQLVQGKSKCLEEFEGQRDRRSHDLNLAAFRCADGLKAPPFSTPMDRRAVPRGHFRGEANGLVLATVHCRDSLQKWSFGHSRLSSHEARKIAKAISRIPEFMMQRRGFYSRGQAN
jgi:hypothetical protein